jgi:hypothetical protein
MKIKKILSSLIALSMIVATAAVPVFAADKATVSTTIVELTDDVIKEADKSDFQNTYEFAITDLGANAHIYKVSSTVTGLGASIAVTTGRGGSKVYNGSVVNVASIKYTFPSDIVYSDEYGDVLPKKSASDTNELGMSASGIKGALTFATDAVADATVMHPYAEAIATGADAAFDGFTVTGYIVTNTAVSDINVELVVDISAITNSAAGALIKTFSDANKNVEYVSGTSEVAVESVTLDKSSVELDLNGTTTATLTATVTPDNATDKTVTWTTSDADVATVENGVVTAKKVGTATITAKAGDKSATCEVTVKDSTPVTPTYPAIGTKIAEDADSNAVYYAGYAESNGEKPLNANTTFEVKNGKDSKMIKSTLGEILGLEGTGTIVGKLHFGVKVMSGSGIDPTKFEIIVH